ncbi:MAG: hypothetical protein ABSH15_07550 [Verrucomicrobiota bacterium]|jgi:hypothetical protein
MIADESHKTPAIGTPDSEVLDAGAFRREIVAFVERELPVWRDRPERPDCDDEPHLNEFLCGHLNSATRRQCFDAVQFLPEPVQTASRRGDIAVKPLGTIRVEGRKYYDFEQLLPIECKRLPTPPDSRRSDLEYVHGLPGHRTGGIERFKHGLHGSTNQHALMIAYVQAKSFAHWLTAINARLAKLAADEADEGIWNPSESLSPCASTRSSETQRFKSCHRRLSPPCSSDKVEMEHIWLQMN